MKQIHMYSFKQKCIHIQYTYINNCSNFISWSDAWLILNTLFINFIQEIWSIYQIQNNPLIQYEIVQSVFLFRDLTVFISFINFCITIITFISYSQNSSSRRVSIPQFIHFVVFNYYVFQFLLFIVLFNFHKSFLYHYPNKFTFTQEYQHVVLYVTLTKTNLSRKWTDKK